MDFEREEAAREALERADLSGPVSPYALARSRRLQVYDGGPGCPGYLVGSKIIVDCSQRPQKRAFDVAHEIGHHIQREAGLPNTEVGANYLASALLCPRLDFEPDLRRWGWDLIRLALRYVYASFEALARRIVALRDARACIFDRPLLGQRQPTSYVIPWQHGRPTDEERIAADEAISSGSRVELRPGLVAFPVLEHGWHRAVTLTNL